MNDIHVHPVNAAGKKEIRSPAARALAVVMGLALLLPGVAALAIGTPIPGIDIVVKKNPGGIPVSAPTGADGAYQLKGLAPGDYDLSVGDKPVQTITVGNKGTISGVLSSQDGKASISFNGLVGVVPGAALLKPFEDLAVKHEGIARVNQPIITKDVDNLTQGTASAEPGLPAPGTHGSLKAGGPLPDEKPGIWDRGHEAEMIPYGTAPTPKDGVRIVEIIDEQSSRTAASPKDAGKKAAGSPFGFGRGNTQSAGPGMGADPGLSPGMSPANNMGSPIGPGHGLGGGPTGPGAGRP